VLDERKYQDGRRGSVEGDGEDRG